MTSSTDWQPRASIIISNYNYGRFLPSAIDSALSQTFPQTEVIVVDDGSTDDSRRVIASYEDRIIAILKENGGQGSAFNAGFAASHGELICFLDSDDMFLPEKIATVISEWEQHRDASVIYHRLSAIDSEGKQLWYGKQWPVVIWRGQLRDRVERSGGWWPWPATTGLCFPRSFLEQVLPESSEHFRKGAGDAYLAGLAPFFGPVIGMEQCLARYRIHSSSWTAQFLDQQLGAKRSVQRYVREFDLVCRTLRHRCGQETLMSLQDHYQYQHLRRRAGESVSVVQVLAALVRSPFLPGRVKAREAARVATNRA